MKASCVKTFLWKFLWIYLQCIIILQRWKSHAYGSISIFLLLSKRPDDGLISWNMLLVLSCLTCCVWLILRKYICNYFCSNKAVRCRSKCSFRNWKLWSKSFLLREIHAVNYTEPSSVGLLTLTNATVLWIM